MTSLQKATKRRPSILLLSLLFLGPPALAAEPPAVKVELIPEVVAVGEPVTLQISVFAPTWFPQPPSFPSFELPNTITRLPPDSSGPVTQRVGSSTWAGIQRNYQVFPLIGGRFEIKGRSLGVTYADPQTLQPVTVDLPIPDLVFESRVPTGAESLNPYLAGQSLELRRNLEGDTTGLAAGDALVIRYRATLVGLPSLFLPPLFVATDHPGLSIYADAPRFSDENGEAIREEKVTAVFDSGGKFTLPPVELPWWNLRTEAIEVAKIPALSIRVEGPAGLSVLSAPTTISKISWTAALMLAGLMALALFLARRPIAKLVQLRQVRRARHLESEAFAFRQLSRTLQAAIAHDSYNLLLRWVARLPHSPGLEEFCTAAGNAQLTAELTQLRATLFAHASQAPDYRQLSDSLRRARKAYLEHTASARLPVALPALNP